MEQLEREGNKADDPTGSRCILPNDPTGSGNDPTGSGTTQNVVFATQNLQAQQWYQRAAADIPFHISEEIAYEAVNMGMAPSITTPVPAAPADYPSMTTPSKGDAPQHPMPDPDTEHLSDLHVAAIHKQTQIEAKLDISPVPEN